MQKLIPYSRGDPSCDLKMWKVYLVIELDPIRNVVLWRYLVLVVTACLAESVRGAQWANYCGSFKRLLEVIYARFGCEVLSVDFRILQEFSKPHMRENAAMRQPRGF